MVLKNLEFNHKEKIGLVTLTPHQYDMWYVYEKSTYKINPIIIIL